MSLIRTRISGRFALCAMRWLVIGCWVLNCGEKPSAADEPPLIDYRESSLDNGLRVISVEDFSTPLVNVQLWYHVGSKDEQPERQGFAHMFEHMMFRGTDRLGPTDHFDYVRRTGGSCNAYTTFDQTVYHETLPAHQLELALWLEAQRMSFLKIDQTAFDTERKVVEEERRLGLNQPFGSVFEKVLAEVFHVHPYRWSPIGKIPHLRASAVSELREFWMRYYVPNNATLVVVGAVKHGEVQQLARRHFDWIPRREDVPRVASKEPRPSEARAIVVPEDNAPAPVAGMVFRTVALDHEDRAPLELLTQILGGGDSSRLYRRLVAQEKLAVQALSLDFMLEQDGVLILGAVLSPFGAKPDRVIEILNEELARAAAEPVTDRELLKARNQLLKQTVSQLLTAEGKARLLGEAAVLQGGANRVNELLPKIRSATKEDLKRVASAYLTPAAALTIRVNASGFGGKKNDAEEQAPITAATEENPPPPGRPGLSRPADYLVTAPVAPPVDVRAQFDSVRRELPNGLTVIVVPNHEVPLVTMQLGFLNGAWTETKPGTASMAFGMLTKGTSRHTEEQLAEELGTYAINLDGSAGEDTGSVSASCLTEHLPRAIELLAEVTRQPTFPAEEFEKLRKQVSTQLAVAAAEPAYVADRELERRLYGHHPYSRTATGEVADVAALTLDDLSAWWKTFARPDAATLIFAGDVEADEAIRLAESALGDWTIKEPAPRISLPTIPEPSSTQIFLVDRPKSTQSQILVGQLGITRDHPGYFTSRVVNGYFGGAFSSRLNETIRVKKGLTYGARGGFEPYRFAGQFQISTFSKTESTADAVKAVFEELKRLQAEPPTRDELDKTRSYLVGSFALERETPQRVAADLWLIESHGLPADYFDRQLSAVRNTNEPECLKLAKSAIDPNRMVVVVVGQAEAISKPLAEIAPVMLVEEEETR